MDRAVTRNVVCILASNMGDWEHVALAVRCSLPKPVTDGRDVTWNVVVLSLWGIDHSLSLRALLNGCETSPPSESIRHRTSYYWDLEGCIVQTG